MPVTSAFDLYPRWRTDLTGGGHMTNRPTTLTDFLRRDIVNSMRSNNIGTIVLMASILIGGCSGASVSDTPIGEDLEAEAAADEAAIGTSTSPPGVSTTSPETATPTADPTVVGPELGTDCAKVGDTAGLLECRQTSLGLEWASTELGNPRPDTYGDDQPCQLPDQRTEPRSAEIGLVIGFPLSLSGVRTPSVGTATLAAVAVDFPDYKGTDSELSRLQESATAFDSWLAIESNQRLSTSWSFHEEWITMSRPVADYKVQGFGTEPYQELSTEIVDRVLDVMELRELDELFVYFPDTLTSTGMDLDNAFDSLLPQIGIPDREQSQYDYSRLRNMKGSGTISKRNGNVLWAGWAHEFLHALGVQLHGPEATMLIDSVSNHSFTLSAWNRWILGWLDNDQIACVSIGDQPVEVDLVPLEMTGEIEGIRAAIVPLTETGALLVQAHRAIGHSANNGFGFGQGIGDNGTYGIAAMYIDSDETAPYDPFTNDDSAGTRFLYANELLDGERSNVGTLAFPESEFQPLVLQGESVSAEGILIEFIASGGIDTIRISRTP